MNNMAVGQSVRNVEKILEESQLTGELQLSGFGIRELPPGHRSAYIDLLTADLSRNRLQELPAQLQESCCLEQLQLQHNSLRQLTDSIAALRSLSVLNLSRNQLSYLPAGLCKLPLQVLIVSFNKLVSLPEEIGQLGATLCELDVHCNELSQLPVTLVKLERLASLNLRKNSLHHLPDDIGCLACLRLLDVAENLLCALPLRLRLLTNLQRLDVSANPLLHPPASSCVRGLRHVFKWLELRAQRDQLEERARRGSEMLQARPVPVGADVSPSPGLGARLDSALIGARHSVSGAERSWAPPTVTTGSGRPGSASGRLSRPSSSAFSPAYGCSPSLFRVSGSKAASCPSPLASTEFTGSVGSSPHTSIGSTISGSLSSAYSATSSDNHSLGSLSTPLESPCSSLVSAPVPPVYAPNSVTASFSSSNHVSPRKGSCPNSGKSPGCRRSSADEGTPGRQFTLPDRVDGHTPVSRECVERLRKNIETRLRVSLPEDLSVALRDGVVLCHLANHVRSRAVPSIHVPSPAVPQLNEAKCRRNLTNFIEACRSIGVEEEPLRSAHFFVRSQLLPSPPSLSPSCVPPDCDPAWLNSRLLSAVLVAGWVFVLLLPESL